MRKVRIAMVSFLSRFNRVQANVTHMIEFMGEAARCQAELICFPELAVQGLFTDAATMGQSAEPLDGPACRQLIEAAREYHIVVSTGMAVKTGNSTMVNAQVYLGADGVLGYAAKVHRCDCDMIYDAGDVWPVFDLGFAKVGTLICYDGEFPEAARCLALEGAEVIVMSFANGRCDPTGKPYDPKLWREQVLRWAPARAIENRAYVIACNHAGDVRDEDGIAGIPLIEPGQMHHWPGYSFVLDPTGQIVAETPRDDTGEHLLIAELDPDVINYWRKSANFLARRRPETYKRLQKK